MQPTDKSLFSAIALTLFPEMFPGSLGYSLAGRALANGIWALQAIDIRDFATDKHATVDAPPYGGGAGMVMKPDVVDAAVTHAKTLLPKAKVLYTSPRGVPITQGLVETLKNEELIILCGRFEGVDQRVIDHHDMLEISLGDFVLSGGELAALSLLDACVRLLPGVMGNPETLKHESFSPPQNRAQAGAPAMSSSSCENQQIFMEKMQDFAGLLEYPHYTRPSIWNEKSVPDVLLSGNHKQIHAWRLEQAKQITLARRPDLINGKVKKE